MRTVASLRRSYDNFFFFFQAEDGIRDDLVTGVQTCALPIFVLAKKCAQPCLRGGPWAAHLLQPNSGQAGDIFLLLGWAQQRSFSPQPRCPAIQSHATQARSVYPARPVRQGDCESDERR